MASFKFAVLLFIGLQGSALTFNADGWENVPDALTANANACQDCTKIFEVLVDLLSDAELQKKIMSVFEAVCDHLPEPATTTKVCKEEVDKIFPVAINFIIAAVRPADVCKVTGFCGSADTEPGSVALLRSSIQEALALAGTNDVQSTTQCGFCIFLVRTLEDLLPKERTEGTVIKVMEEVCLILPLSYRLQCDAVIGKFSKTILEAILSYATPQAICALVRLCKGQEGPLVDPCTLKTYRCRDVNTALKCGTLFYCQKFGWKPLSDNAL